tara:strand:- start:1089 stop:1799 length:711 start_codon:yes stop_codon:yes gene_type:complete
MKNKKISAGQNIKVKDGEWSFSKIEKKFDKHINTSVPFYDEGHEIITNISTFFLMKKSRCLDIGCSTGTLLNKINSRLKNRNIIYTGLDTQLGMIRESKRKNKNINFLNKDFFKIKLKSQDMIISYYTAQFIPPKKRHIFFKKIFDTLDWGGAFVLFEKIRAPDARFQDIFSLIYQDFKIDKGHDYVSIIAKSKSLKGVLEPFSDKGNLFLLKKSGFKDITPIFQWLSFKGYLCIK